eukprot:14310403-Alexandrium_andersonii.AAC.1
MCVADAPPADVCGLGRWQPTCAADSVYSPVRSAADGKRLRWDHRLSCWQVRGGLAGKDQDCHDRATSDEDPRAL